MENWKSQEREELDLELENQSLELDQRLKGGVFFGNEDVDPRMHNQFLRNIQRYEECKSQSVKDLFSADMPFKQAEDFSKKQLKEALRNIMETLSFHGIIVCIQSKLPDEVLYTYLTKEFIPNESIVMPHESGMRYVIDGCDGYCPECFQKDYCETAHEIGWDEENI
jgi:hypothetical protein